MGLFTIYKSIEKELEQGASRTDVFGKYSAKTPTDTPKIAYMLASIPYPELRQRYLKLNACLFLLLLCLPVLTVMAEWPIDFREPTLFLAIKISVPLILAYFVFHFHGGIYRILGLWCLIDLLESLVLLNFTSGVGFSKAVLLFLIVVICFILSQKVFPNLKVLRPRQDDQGRYLL